MDMDYLLPNPRRYAPDRLRECLDHFGIKYPANATKQTLCRLYNEEIKPMQDDPLMLRDFITSKQEESGTALDAGGDDDDAHDNDDVPTFIQILSDEALLKCLQKLDHGPPAQITEANRRYSERRYTELLSLGVSPVTPDPDRYEAAPVTDGDGPLGRHIRRRTRDSGGDAVPLLNSGVAGDQRGGGGHSKRRARWLGGLTMRHWMVLLSAVAAVAALVAFLAVTIA